MLSRVDCLEKDRFLGFLLGGRVGAGGCKLSPPSKNCYQKAFFFENFWNLFEFLQI